MDLRLILPTKLILALPGLFKGAQNTYMSLQLGESHLTQSLFYNKMLTLSYN